VYPLRRDSDLRQISGVLDGKCREESEAFSSINLTRQIRVVPLESSPVRQNELDLDDTADALDPDSASRVGRAVGDRRVVRSSFT